MAPDEPRGPLTPSVLCIFGLLAILLAVTVAWGVASGQVMKVEISRESPRAKPEVKAGLRPRTHHSLIADIDSGICSDPERHVEEAVRELVGRKASLGDEVNP
jgi:hypothetical protein